MDEVGGLGGFGRTSQFKGKVLPDLSYCAQQVRRADYDRFLCTLFAQPAEREALLALYAFNDEIARVREAASEPMLGRMRLQWWRDAIAGVYAGQRRREPAVAALAEAIEKFGLTRAHFEQLIEGREFDCEDRPPATLDHLVSYAAATAAPLVTLSAEVCGARDGAVAVAAADTGVAWALTGLLRAVPFHARSRRLYLPAALNRQHNLDPFAMFEKGAVPGLAAVVAAVAACARDHLCRARAARSAVPAKALPAFLPATLANLYLKRIAAAGDNPFHPRVQDPAGLGRIAVLLLARLRGRY